MLDFLIDIMGFSVCHQLSSRSLSIGDVILPVCSRCSGIYIGFSIAAIILFAMFRKKENDLPPLYILVILALFFFSTIADGIASNFGLYIIDLTFTVNNHIHGVIQPVYDRSYVGLTENGGYRA